MATPKQLVEKAAEITGVSVATVIVHDRNLSNSSLRTVAGRGRAAAKVTAEDAANLLIAIAASELVKDSAATVLKYRKLVAVHDLKCGISSYDRLAHGHTFGDALTSLFLAASTGEITYAEDLKMKVVFRNPRVTARIEWSIDGHAEFRMVMM